MKRSVFLMILFFVACTSSRNDYDKLEGFVMEWSNAVAARNDKAVMRFYDPAFVFPKVLFDLPEGVRYKLDLDNLQPHTSNDDEIEITIPFNIAYGDGAENERGALTLTVIRSGDRYLIKDMTQELAMKIKTVALRLEQKNQPSEASLNYDSVFAGFKATATSLSQYYDSVVFFTETSRGTLYYVVNGNWQTPYGYENQRDSGDYKMGVVTETNQVIVPVEYDKVYNPDGSFDGLIEVERNGMRGLFDISGGVFLPCEYDGIYPAHAPGVFAQVKKSDRYGWVDLSGKAYFEPTSHSDKRLFKSPIESDAILGWEFVYPGNIKLLIEAHADASEATGVIIYPSYVKDFGITDIANNFVQLSSSEYGMGMTDTKITFEKVQTLSDQFYGLVSLFMEAGADARGYQTERNDLVVVDNQMQIISKLKALSQNDHTQDPCGGQPQYRIVEPGLYESNDGHGIYAYYKVNSDGSIEEQRTMRDYNFTKFAKIDASYFAACRYEQLDYNDWGDGKPNLVIIRGLSREDLDVMRNEIFADYGYIFKSEKWKSYFESKPWYKPQYDNVDAFMTETDKYNVKFILDHQKANPGLVEERDSIQFMWAG